MRGFFHRMQKPQSGSQIDLFDPSTKTTSIENQEKKDAEEGERRDLENEDACSPPSQVSSAPPALSSTTGTGPPTWGQLKKLTQRAQRTVSDTRNPPSAENMSLAVRAVVAMRVYCAPVTSFWACVPHPPLLHAVGWGDDVSIRVMTDNPELLGGHVGFSSHLISL